MNREARDWGGGYPQSQVSPLIKFLLQIRPSSYDVKTWKLRLPRGYSVPVFQAGHIKSTKSQTFLIILSFGARIFFYTYAFPRKLNGLANI